MIELERFSRKSLHQWHIAERKLRNLHQTHFYGLEQQRQEHSAALVDALRSNANAGFRFDGWARIIDFRHSNTPLSVAGSLRNGGRFNIGAGIDAAAFTPFPALYIAQDYHTAFRERFAIAPDESKKGISGQEYALRTPGSFTHVALRGQLESVIDVGDPKALKDFADILSRFTVPKASVRLYRELGVRVPGLVRSASGLQRQLLNPNWRAEPMQFDLPSNSQIFGRIAAAAGLHGIAYLSARASNARCLALFPQNWHLSASFVEVTGGSPTEARLTRIDGSSTRFE